MTNERRHVALRAVQLSMHIGSQIGAGVLVDREAGIVRNVPVITLGMTRTSGNGIPPFMVDDTTLQQVADAINRRADVGLRSHITHPTLSGEDGLQTTIGVWRNARMVGGRVIADCHVGTFAAHSPRGNLREFLLGIAEEAPAHVGVSINTTQAHFVDGPEPGTAVLRVDELNAIDWVDIPAANPMGLLGAAPQSGASPVTTTNPAIVPGGSMYTEAQIAVLRELGLPEGATEAEIAAFIESLDEAGKAKFLGAGSPQGTRSPASGTGASATPSVSAGAASTSAPITANQQVIPMATLSEINQIARLGDMPAHWAVEMVLSGKTVAEAREIALAAKERKQRPVQLSGAGSVTVGANLAQQGLDEAIVDAILLRAGTGLAEYEAAPAAGGIGGRVMLSASGGVQARQPSQRAKEFRSHSLVEMGRRYLIALGYREADQLPRTTLASLLMSRRRLESVLHRSGVQLSHATGDFPYLLADAMGKSLRQAYATASPTWPLWCRRNTAPDFKNIKRLQLSEASSLDALSEGEEYAYGTMTESREQYSLGKYGKGISFTWEMLINDDLDAFSRVPMMLGRACSRLEETTAIGILTANATMSDSVALFATAHANLTTGALSTSTLGVARSLMRKQTPLGGDSSNPLELTPKVLIVPEDLSATAEQLVGSTVDPSKYNATPNLAFVQRLVVASSARLSATSPIQWYLAADYNEIDTVEMSFLEGEEGPTIMEEDEFDTDTRKIKVRHVVAAKAIDHRGLVRSSGT